MDKRRRRSTGIYDTREQLVQGVSRFLSGGKSIAETARLTGVSKSIVSRIRDGDKPVVSVEPYVPQARRLDALWTPTAC